MSTPSLRFIDLFTFLLLSRSKSLNFNGAINKTKKFITLEAKNSLMFVHIKGRHLKNVLKPVWKKIKICYQYTSLDHMPEQLVSVSYLVLSPNKNKIKIHTLVVLTYRHISIHFSCLLFCSLLHTRLDFFFLFYFIHTLHIFSHTHTLIVCGESISNAIRKFKKHNFRRNTQFSVVCARD